MKNIIPIPDIDYKTKLIEIFNSKEREDTRNSLLSLHNDLLLRFALYNKNKKNLENITASPNEIINISHLLLELYNSPVKSADYITKIRELETECCPYCGKHGKPETLDHYLPKDSYPEFSIYHLNLIPCCDRCNRKKSTNCLKDNKRLFINPYFDEYLNEIFIEVNIIAPYTTPLFKINIISGFIPKDFLEIYESHIKLLDIKSALKINFENQIKWIKNTYGVKKIKLTELKKDIKKYLCADEISFGKNNWRCCLYRSMLTNKDFLKDYYKEILITM